MLGCDTSSNVPISVFSPPPFSAALVSQVPRLGPALPSVDSPCLASWLGLGFREQRKKKRGDVRASLPPFRESAGVLHLRGVAPRLKSPQGRPLRRPRYSGTNGEAVGHTGRWRAVTVCLRATSESRAALREVHYSVRPQQRQISLPASSHDLTTSFFLSLGFLRSQLTCICRLFSDPANITGIRGTDPGSPARRPYALRRNKPD